VNLAQAIEIRQVIDAALGPAHFRPLDGIAGTGQCPREVVMLAGCALLTMHQDNPDGVLGMSGRRAKLDRNGKQQMQRENAHGSFDQGGGDRLSRDIRLNA
jgi:hypothetical protein